MAQIFHPSMNTVSRVTIFGAVFFVLSALALNYIIYKSPYVTQVSVVIDQPVPFSHEHHVEGLGIDCRYCHTSVESSSFAGLPPTETCMTCHSQIWSESEMLRPIRESLASGAAMRWNRVHNLPDYAYFHHAVHVRKGVGCSSCHGRVDEMPLTWKAEPLTMEWCLDCHRHPEHALRANPEDVFNMAWTPPPNQTAQGKSLIQERHIPIDRLTNCSTCHR
jgi:hypothetical protein